MPAYYTYLISSLPMLNFNARMPFSLEGFFVKCRGLVPEKEFEILSALEELETRFLTLQKVSTLRLWFEFEITLRNELARARAARKKIDPSRFLRLPDSPQAQISHVAMSAYRSTSILEGERILDQARWDFLEALSLGHYFDFDYLLIYGLKLKLLERWENIQKADKEYLLNQAILN